MTKSSSSPWQIFGCLLFGGLVVFVLAAILFPVFASAQAAAKKTACLSNTKQSLTTLIMYSVDFDNKMPYRDTWMDQTLPVSKNEGIWHCPELKSPTSQMFGYAFNSRLSRNPVTYVEQPQEMPLVYDSLNLARNASDPFISLPPIPHDGERPRRSVGYLDGRATLVGPAIEPQADTGS